MRSPQFEDVSSQDLQTAAEALSRITDLRIEVQASMREGSEPANWIPTLVDTLESLRNRRENRMRARPVA